MEKNKFQDIINITDKIADELGFAGIFDDACALISYYKFDKKEFKKQQEKVRARIHKMHNSLFAIEQMVDDLKWED